MNKENVKEYNEANETATIGIGLALVKAEYEKIKNIIKSELTVEIK